MKSAVCMLLPLSPAPDAAYRDIRFLAVSRRNDTTRWGFPGGKVDEGESNLEAVVREIFEETGLVLDARELEPIFSDVCPGKGPEDTYWVTTYVWKRPAGPLEQLLTLEEGLTFAWQTPGQLADPALSPFASYNHGAFEAYWRFAYA